MGAEMSYDALVERLLEGPWWVVDILPEQVPADSEGQYFAVERYYRQPARIAAIHRGHAEVLLRLNCYYDMAVSFDAGETWERNPEPEAFVERASSLSGNDYLRALFVSQEAMVDVEPDDTWMTVFCHGRPALFDKLQKLAASEGLFLWQPVCK